MRKALSALVILCVATGALAAPAAAKKRKPKKPVTFEASGSFLLSNPGDFAADTGITRNEFAQTCAVPTTQGLDGFVIELSNKISAVNANVVLAGGDVTGAHDLDMYFYDAECNATGAASTEASDEMGMFAAGTRWVVVTAFAGVELEFTLNAEEATT